MSFAYLLFTIPLFWALLAAFIFLFRNSKDQANRILLGVIFLIVLLQISIFLLIYGGKIQDIDFLYRIKGPISYLTASLIYIYVFRQVKDCRNSLLSYLVHLIFFLLATADMIWSFSPNNFHYYFRFVVRFFYLSLQWRVLIKDGWSRKQEPHIRWIFLFTGFQTLIQVLFAGFALHLAFANGIHQAPPDHRVMGITLVITSFALGILSLYLFLHPEILYGAAPSAELTDHDVKPAFPQEIQKAEVIKVPEAEDQVERLKTYMEEECPYLRKRLSLSDVAAEIDLPPHLLSALLNQYYGKSFSDFVNEYRIGYALKKMANCDWQQYTIEAIAGESGFSSRTAFYNAFKKTTGKSPRVYLLSEENNAQTKA